MARSFRRMLANGNPKRSNFNKLWPIHSQQIDRRCSDIRESNNNKSADGPIEVIKPAIAMRMKQAGFQTLVSDSGYPIGFMPIAGRARETEVFELCRTAERQRKNVFYWCNATAAPAFTRLSSSIFFSRRSSSCDSSAASTPSVFRAKRSSNLDWFLGANAISANAVNPSVLTIRLISLGI